MPLGPSKRSILIIVAGDKRANPGGFDGLPVNMPLRKVAIAAIAAFEKDERGGFPLPDADKFRTFDWDLEEIPSHSVVGQIPQPGIVLLVKVGTDPNTIFQEAFIAKANCEERPQCKSFLAGTSSRFVPHPPSLHDVFLAYATPDEDAAMELHQQLTEADLAVYLVKVNIGAGAIWTEALRDAISTSRMGMILLTPNSWKSAWVMCEAGALWVLGKRIVAAWKYIDITQLPETITMFQARRIETHKEQMDLVSEIKSQLRE